MRPWKKYLIINKREPFYKYVGVLVHVYDIHALFDKLTLFGRDLDHKQCSFHIKDWDFIELFNKSLANQIARGLCDRIPEDCAGIIEEFLIGVGSLGVGSLGHGAMGTHRYPLR